MQGRNKKWRKRNIGNIALLAFHPDCGGRVDSDSLAPVIPPVSSGSAQPIVASSSSLNLVHFHGRVA